MLLLELYDLLWNPWTVATQNPWLLALLLVLAPLAVATAVIAPWRSSWAPPLSLCTGILFWGLSVDVVVRRSKVVDQFEHFYPHSAGTDAANVLSFLESLGALPHYALLVGICVFLSVLRSWWDGDFGPFSPRKATLLAFSAVISTGVGLMAALTMLQWGGSTTEHVAIPIAVCILSSTLQWWTLSHVGTSTQSVSRHGGGSCVRGLMVSLLPLIAGAAVFAAIAAWPRPFVCSAVGGISPLLLWEFDVRMAFASLAVGWWCTGVPLTMLIVHWLFRISSDTHMVREVVVELLMPTGLTLVGMIFVSTCTEPIPLGNAQEPWRSVAAGVDVPIASLGRSWGSFPSASHIQRWNGQTWKRWKMSGAAANREADIIVAPSSMLGRELRLLLPQPAVIFVLVRFDGAQARWSPIGPWRAVALEHDANAPSVAHLPLNEVVKRCGSIGIWGHGVQRCSW